METTTSFTHNNNVNFYQFFHKSNENARHNNTKRKSYERDDCMSDGKPVFTTICEIERKSKENVENI
jgi:hypothetical protein